MQSEPIGAKPLLERALAASIADLLHEIRDHDVANLIAFVQMERFTTLRCLIDADCDMHFRPQAMSFGQRAEVQASWFDPPAVEMAMEFRYDGIEMFYRLRLGGVDKRLPVAIDLLRVEGSRAGAVDVERLQRALRLARCERTREERPGGMT